MLIRVEILFKVNEIYSALAGCLHDIQVKCSIFGHIWEHATLAKRKSKLYRILQQETAVNDLSDNTAKPGLPVPVASSTRNKTQADTAARNSAAFITQLINTARLQKRDALRRGRTAKIANEAYSAAAQIAATEIRNDKITLTFI